MLTIMLKKVLLHDRVWHRWMTPIWVVSEVTASADGGKIPFVAAVQTNDEGYLQRIKFSVVDGFRKRDIARWAERHLAADTHVVSDSLNCFDAVREAGYAHEAIISGGGRTAL